MLSGYPLASALTARLTRRWLKRRRWHIAGSAIEPGEFPTNAELAEREGIAFTYMARVLRLTLLMPQVVEAIVEGRHGPDVTLARLLAPFPIEWDRQLKMGLARLDADEVHRRAPSTSAKKKGKNPNEQSYRRT